MIIKIRRTLGELGAGNTCLYALDRAFQRLPGGLRFFRYYLVAQPVPEDGTALGRTNIKVRELAPGDPALRRMPLTDEVLDYRFGQPAVCFGAFVKEDLVAYAWLCLGPYEEDEVACRFVPEAPNGAAWDFDVYVFPERRLTRAFTGLWDAVNRHLRASNIAWSMSRISAFKPGSLAAHVRMGSRRVGSAIFLRARGFQLMVASVRPYVHLSLSGRSRPVIRVRPPSR